MNYTNMFADSILKTNNPVSINQCQKPERKPIFLILLQSMKTWLQIYKSRESYQYKTKNNNFENTVSWHPKELMSIRALEAIWANLVS